MGFKFDGPGISILNRPIGGRDMLIGGSHDFAASPIQRISLHNNDEALLIHASAAQEINIGNEQQDDQPTLGLEQSKFHKWESIGG